MTTTKGDDTMGMTDAQWKNDLRNQLEDWEEVQKLLQDGKQAEAEAKIEKVKKRIQEGIES